MNRMKMHGAFRESLAGTTAQSMTSDSFLSMLLHREWDWRAQAAVTRLTKNAEFRYKAYPEEIDYATNRGLDRNQMERLATLDFVRNGQNLFITGSVFRCDSLQYVYLDQEYSLIDNELSVYDQLQRFNRHALPEHELKIRLNRFLFAKQAYDKQCVALSGGEKMRLSLCCLMVSDSTPDIIIADEPTNNLDLYNIETLTNMLNKYSGTLIVISHDSEFAQRLSLSKEIVL